MLDKKKRRPWARPRRGYSRQGSFLEIVSHRRSNAVSFGMFSGCDVRSEPRMLTLFFI